MIIPMKKYLLILATALMALCTVSCDKDEESIDKKDLYGMWLQTEVLYDGELLHNIPNTTMVINDDGTGSSTVVFGNSDNHTTEFKWSVKGKTIKYEDTAYYTNGVLDTDITEFSKIQMTVKKLTSDKLVVTYKDEFDEEKHNVQVTFEKIPEILEVLD